MFLLEIIVRIDIAAEKTNSAAGLEKPEEHLVDNGLVRPSP